MSTILEALRALNNTKLQTRKLSKKPMFEHVEKKFLPITVEDEHFFRSRKHQVEPQMECLNEDVENSMPVTILPEQSIIDFVMAIEPATKGRPLKHFKLGYISELTKEIAAKYKGGRGSVNRETGEAYDFVRIFKCTEYSSLETATNPRTTRMGLAADKILGTERHTGERTGFNYEADEYAFRIGQYPDGSKALQACINADSRQRVKYFISINHSDLQEVPVADILQYLTPAEAGKLSAPRVYKPAGQDTEGRDVYDKPNNRFKLNKIYMIGNLGSSIMNGVREKFVFNEEREDNSTDFVIENGVLLHYAGNADHVEIPHTVVKIGKEAFKHSKVVSVNIPSSVTEIGERAFYYCELLKHVTLSEGLTTIGNQAFQSCSSLESVEIPNSVTHIGDYTFNWCDDLKNVKMSNNVRTLGEGAFSSCSNLVNITLPNKLEVLEANLFTFSSLTSIEIPASVEFIENSAFERTDLRKVIIPSNVSVIGKNAFSGCENLSEVIFENDSKLNVIEDYAFAECSNLKSIELPESVTSINIGAFRKCVNLESIVIPYEVLELGYGVFEDCNNLTIYCKDAWEPDDWAEDWNISNLPVHWNC